MMNVGPPAGPNRPTLAVQAVAAELPAGELEFAGHFVQMLAVLPPVTTEYLSVGQSAQAVEPLRSLYFLASISHSASRALGSIHETS